MQGDSCKVEAVCRWLEAVEQAQSEGKQPHSDDMRAGQHLCTCMEGGL